MPWSKGAVVIKKHGDQKWADEMEKIFEVDGDGEGVPVKDQEKEDLKRDNQFMKKHVVEGLEKKIMDAELEYGYHPVRPRWMQCIMEGFAFVIYYISIFVDKYLILR